MNVIIIGGGQVGSHVGNLLLENGINIKIVDNRAFIIEKLKKNSRKMFFVLAMAQTQILWKNLASPQRMSWLPLPAKMKLT